MALEIAKTGALLRLVLEENWQEAGQLLPDVSDLREVGGFLSVAAPQLSADSRLKAALKTSTVNWLLADEAIEQAGVALRTLDWAIIKGAHTGTTFYRQREQRRLADVDVVVRPADLEAAVAALEQSGWSPVWPDPICLRYVREEGYAWQVSRPGACCLEVHYRPWASLSAGSFTVMLDHASATSGNGGGSPAAEHAYVIAAVHGWNTKVPRSLSGWLDLHHIAEDDRSGAARVVRIAKEWDCQLPVALAAAAIGELLGKTAFHGDVAAELATHLRPLERWVWQRWRGMRAIDGLSLARIEAARFLSLRRTRAPLRRLWRRLWPHAGADGNLAGLPKLRRRWQIERGVLRASGAPRIDGPGPESAGNRASRGAR